MFFKKKNIYAVANGTVIDITTVNDPVFSSKALGDGVAVIPADGKVSAPMEGEITMLFPTNHAFSVINKDGIEVLVHIGIDTVQLEGKGFKAVAQVGDKVKPGTPVIEVDLDVLKAENIDTTILMIVSDVNGKEIKTLATTAGQKAVSGKTEVISY
ncbi:MAG: hypothetical protein BEN18_10140 [Epulopiscium sp. Nuni2H_MBin001]|nr:MAG: hypothetical protein BEN18_10140 [Epulopiscium sp. Nuni2H_MBin001]